MDFFAAFFARAKKRSLLGFDWIVDGDDDEMRVHRQLNFVRSNKLTHFIHPRYTF